MDPERSTPEDPERSARGGPERPAPDVDREPSADVDREPSAGVDPEGSIPSPPEPFRVNLTRGRLVAIALFVLSALALLYFVLPKLLGLGQTWNRLERGDGWWLALGAVLEFCSFAGYVVLFRAVFARRRGQIRWRESYQITMAGVAATRVFASAGAGGIALTVWALRRSGMEARQVARRMVAFMVLLYGVYMVALVVCGLGLYTGLIPGRAPAAITLAPAGFGAFVIACFLAMAFLPGDLERLAERFSGARRRGSRVARALAAAPATVATGTRAALELLRSRDPRLLGGAVAWWGFDMAVLWSCFHAFGAAPPKGEIVMAYLVGMLANTLPLPGGIGGVDGGMIGAFTAFGLPVQVTVVSVLAYRVFAFWLPTAPGVVAYVQLRRTVQRWRAVPTPRPAQGGPAGGSENPSYT